MKYTKKSGLALIPFLVFIVIYLGAGPRHRVDVPGRPFKEDVHGPQRVQPDAFHHICPEGF